MRQYDSTVPGYLVTTSPLEVPILRDGLEHMQDFASYADQQGSIELRRDLLTLGYATFTVDKENKLVGLAVKPFPEVMIVPSTLHVAGLATRSFLEYAPRLREREQKKAARSMLGVIYREEERFLESLHERVDTFLRTRGHSI